MKRFLKYRRSRARRRAARRRVGASYPGCVRPPRRRSDRQSEARAARYYALAPVMHAWRLRPVPRSHDRLAPARAAFRRMSPPPRAHPLAPVGHAATEKPPRHAPGHIKPPFPFPSRARANRRRPPLAPPVSSPSCLSPWPTRSSKLFPSPHVSFQSRLMA
jgi:hypothetical protein